MRLGQHQVDLDRGVVSRNNEEIHISPRAAAVLADLIQADGEVVLTEDLIERHWRAEVTTPNSVHKTINELRAAFDDDAKNSRYIETIPKKGYRLHAHKRQNRFTPSGWRRSLRWQLLVAVFGALVAGIWLHSIIGQSSSDFRSFPSLPVICR